MLLLGFVTLTIVALQGIYIHRCWDAIPDNAINWKNWTSRALMLEDSEGKGYIGGWLYRSYSLTSE